MPLPLSVAIVCKNNERTIGRVLGSVAALAAEIVAVDSGSTDGTLSLLEKHGARVIRTEWRGFVATKQLALEECRQPWVLCLDSDESVEPDLGAAIAEVARRDDPLIAGARVNRKIWYRGRFLEYAWQPERRLRLVRRGRARWAGLDPHDRMEILPGESARVVDLAGTLRHDAFLTFVEQLAKNVGHSRVAARALYDSGGRASRFRLLTSPAGAFFKQLILKQAWRDGRAGWMAAATVAANALMKHVALLEIAEAEKGRNAEVSEAIRGTRSEDKDRNAEVPEGNRGTRRGGLNG